MTVFWLLLVLLGCVASMFVMWPLLRSDQMAFSQYQNTELSEQPLRAKSHVYQEQMSSLQHDLNQSLLSQEEYDRHTLIMQRELLHEQGTQVGTLVSSLSPPWLMIVTALLVVMGSYVAYLYLGASATLTQQTNMQTTAALLHEDDNDQIIITKLHQQLQHDPNNPEAWYVLAHALLNEGKVDAALQAFDQGLAYVEVTQPLRVSLLGQYAQALVAVDHGFSERADQVLDEATSINPTEVSILSLRGLREFSNGNYLHAIDLWQQASQQPLDTHRRVALQASIEQAREAMQADQAGHRIHLNIRTAQGLEVPEQAAVYIYVLTPDRTLPLWVARIKASNLPTRFVMSEAFALKPGAHIKDYDTVTIRVHVSKEGTVGVQPNDLLGEVKQVAIPARQLVDVVIDKIVQE